MRIGYGIRTVLSLMNSGEWLTCRQLRARMYAPHIREEETFTYLRRSHARGFVERRGERGAVEWHITQRGLEAIVEPIGEAKDRPRKVMRPIISSVWQLGAM